MQKSHFCRFMWGDIFRTVGLQSFVGFILQQHCRFVLFLSFVKALTQQSKCSVCHHPCLSCSLPVLNAVCRKSFLNFRGLITEAASRRFASRFERGNCFSHLDMFWMVLSSYWRSQKTCCVCDHKLWHIGVWILFHTHTGNMTLQRQWCRVTARCGLFAF